MSRIFLLSPAYAGGQRARMIMSERAQFELARRLRSENRPTLGEVFTFLSGLYFRGKLAYANVFARPALTMNCLTARWRAPRERGSVRRNWSREDMGSNDTSLSTADPDRRTPQNYVIPSRTDGEGPRMHSTASALDQASTSGHVCAFL